VKNEMNNLNTIIHGMPKVELHIHIEGSLEPELMFELAERNGVELRFISAEEVRRAYQFTDLQSFLDIYYESASVLLKEADFYDMTWAYLEKVSAQNVRHCEIFFDPQTHTDRGVPFGTVITGIHRALVDAEQQLNITTRLIMCFLRHLSADAAMQTLKQALPYKDWIVGVGLDSSEVGNPPSKFKAVFDEAHAEGYLAVAHAGEEGPPEYVWQALDLLHTKRIDHGVRSEGDPILLERLVKEQIPLTVCPLSNVRLRGFDSMEEHNLKRLLDLGVCVTVNSDDPAYFGGYMTENYLAVQEALELSLDDLQQLAQNAVIAAFISQEEKQKLLDELVDFFKPYSLDSAATR
jgi:adenosine deaminase